QILVDRLLQRRDTPESPPTDSLLGDLREESLDLVQPGSARRGEVEMILGMPQEPSLHGRRFVCAVVVHHQVDLNAWSLGQTRVDLAQELEELLMPVPAKAATDHFAGGHIQGREQRGRAVPGVVMRPAL